MSISQDIVTTRRRAFLLQVVPAVTYAVAIFYGGLIRMSALPEVGLVATDKLLHGAVFGFLTLLLARAARFFFAHASLPGCLWLGALGASLLGALLEVCQAFVPYRSADPLDWIADTIGAALALGILLVLSRVLPKLVEG